MAAPNGKWELRFPRQDWTLQERKTRPDGNGVYVLFGDAQAKPNASFIIEPATTCRTATGCREMFRADPGPGSKGALGIVDARDPAWSPGLP